MALAVSAGVLAAAAFLPVSQIRAETKGIDTSRILVAGGAITEILYELGVSGRIVAVVTTSQFPAEALKTKKSIGYLRALSTEGVLSMAPSVIIASDKAGPPEVVRALKASGVPYVEIDDTPSPTALLDRIRAVAAVVEKAEDGSRIVARVAADLEALSALRREAGAPIPTLFILSLQNGRVLVGGRNTAADTMLKLANGRNVAEAIDGFKPMTEEMLISLDPHAIVTMTRSSGAPLADELKRIPAIQATTAGKTGAFVEMDALFLMGFGPRTPAAARELMDQLRPTSLKAHVDR